MTADIPPGRTAPPCPELLSPAAFSHALRHHGLRGRLWVQRLAELTGELCGRWQLRHPQPRLQAGRTCVIEVSWRGELHYLKVHPNPADAYGEQAALQAWEHTGLVPLVKRFEPTIGALLLTAAGNPAPTTADVGRRASTLATLHRTPLPPDHRFPPLAGRITSELLRLRHALACGDGDRAALDALDDLMEQCLELLAGQPHVLLHTDVRPDNWFRSDDTLTLIDPQPATGPAPYDLACLYFHHRAVPHAPTRDNDETAEAVRRWMRIIAVLHAANPGSQPIPGVAHAPGSSAAQATTA